MHQASLSGDLTTVTRFQVDLASGEAKLRRPLCKCKGVNGRAALVTLCPKVSGSVGALAPLRSSEKGSSMLSSVLAQCSTNDAKVSPVAAHVRVAAPILASPAEHKPPPPVWRRCVRALDLETLLRGAAPLPEFQDCVELWNDEQDPHSTAWLRVRVLCTETFWVASIRNFVRVNGVMARVVDTRYVCRCGGEVSSMTRDCLCHAMAFAMR